MRKFVVTVVSASVFALLGAIGVLMIGMRTKSSAVLTAVRRFNRKVGNPKQMKTAGTAGAYAAIIRHVGRTSGRQYETPVGATFIDGGFVIALPYGAQADWLKNVLASGSATLVHEGTTYEVDQPQLVPTPTVVQHMAVREQKMLRMFGVEQCLQLHRVEAPAAE